MLNEQGEATRENVGAKVFVEKNRVHMDDTDAAMVLAALEDLGIEAEATEQTTLLKASWWVLTLHWIGDDLPHLGFDSLLTLLGQRVLQHYRDNGKSGPSRIDVKDATDEIIVTHDIESDGPDSSSSQR